MIIEDVLVSSDVYFAFFCSVNCQGLVYQIRIISIQCSHGWWASRELPIAAKLELGNIYNWKEPSTPKDYGDDVFHICQFLTLPITQK